MSLPHTDGQSRSAESYARLETLYKGTFARNIPAGADAAEKEARKDPLFGAKKVVENLMKLLELEAEERQLSPHEIIFVSELVALNTQRAANCPLPADQVEKIKAKARRYYEDSVRVLP